MRRLLPIGLILIAALGCGRRATPPTDAAAAAGTSAGAGQVEPSAATGQSSARAAATLEPAASEAGPHRDLRIDEQLGGHTLSRHVGRTDDELSARLRHERDISAASTYLDQPSAERVVGRALEINQSRIRQWAARHGDRPNLALHYIDRSMSTGRILLRSAAAPRPADGALVVLRWSEERRRWYVLTSYPELAR